MISPEEQDSCRDNALKNSGSCELLRWSRCSDIKWASSHNFRSSGICTTEGNENCRTNADDRSPTFTTADNSSKLPRRLANPGVVRKYKENAAWASRTISPDKESANQKQLDKSQFLPLSSSSMCSTRGIRIAANTKSLLVSESLSLETYWER